MRVRAPRSEHVSVSRLLGSLVGLHLGLDTLEDFLHGVFGFPVNEQRELGLLKHASGLVDGRQVSTGAEPDGGGNLGVLGSALNGEEVDTVVKVGVGGSDDRGVPLAERLVVTLVKTVRNISGTDSLLSSVELLEKSEGTWHYTKDMDGSRRESNQANTRSTSAPTPSNLHPSWYKQSSEFCMQSAAREPST